MPETVSVEPDIVREQLALISNDPLFAKAPSLRKFLEFTVNRVLDGSVADLKEYTIAMEVMGRGESFDTRDSSVVRTQAFNLRTRLKSYYDDRGADAPVRILFEPGNYVPRFITTESQQQTSTQTSPAPHSGPIRLSLPETTVAQKEDKLLFLVDEFRQGLALQLIETGEVHVSTAGTATTSKTAPDMDVLSSMSYADGRVKLQVRLANRHSAGYLVWARNFEWPENTFSPYSASREVALQIAHAAHNALNRAWHAKDSPDPRAKAAVIEGRNYLSRMNAVDCRRAQKRFLEAIDNAPGWAAAHSGFAVAVIQGMLLGDPASLQLSIDAGVSATRALALNWSDPCSQLARGMSLALLDGDLEAASLYLSRVALLRDVSAPDPLLTSGYVLFHLLPRKQFEEAIDTLQPIVDLYPSNTFACYALGSALRLAHRYAEAATVFASALELEDQCRVAALGMAQVLSNQGKFSEAMDALSRAQALSGRTPDVIGLEGYLFASLGQLERAASASSELSTLATLEDNHFFERSLVQVGLGKHKEALFWLDQAIHAGEPAAFLGRIDPVFEQLRTASITSHF